MTMTQDPTPEPSAPNDGQHFLLALAPRLPRMLAVTGVVMLGAFAAIQFIPETFEASLALTPPAGSTAEAERAKIIDQQNLGDVVARLSPELLADLRRNADGVLDTTRLLSKRLALTPSPDGSRLELSAAASTPARARALLEAVAAGHAALAAPPPLEQMGDSAAAQPEPVSAAATPDDSAVQLLQQKLALALEERIRLDARARRIEALASDGNFTTLAMDAETLPGLGRKIDALAQLEAEEARLSIDLLPNHPKMRVIKEEIDGLTSDLSKGVQEFATLVARDRDRAQRVEDSLRTQLAEAMAPAIPDTSVVTGSISEKPEPKIAALPRPIRTDLALAFAGGFSFLAQIGLFSLFRLRQQPLEEIPGLEYVTEPVRDPGSEEDALLEEEFATQDDDHNWLETAPAMEVNAGWLAPFDERPEPEPIKGPAAPPSRDPALAEARVVALTGRDEVNAAARQLLAHYEGLGKRVVLVDAASGRRGRVPGISDLSAGLASFADIVHGSAAEAALVPWGRQQHLDADAKPVRILVQALASLYDVVILMLDDRDKDVSLPLAALAETTVQSTALSEFRSKAA